MEPCRMEMGSMEVCGDESHLLPEPEAAPAAANRCSRLRVLQHLAVGLAGLAAGVLLLGGAFRHLATKPIAPASRLVGGEFQATQLAEEVIVQCPGTFDLPGLNGSTEVQLVNSRVGHLGVDSGQMHIEGGAVVMHMDGRAYFAETCTDGSYSNEDYKSISLLGKTVQFEVDLAGVGCGCNVAFYFVAMKQNSNPSSCQDYYCDANSVCGVPCMEVDVMEANSLVWRSTLHMQDDDVGSASGYGGTGPHQQTWTSAEYGPGAKCIDTNKPFTVLAHFPMHDGGKFQGMMVDLQQEDSPCDALTASVGWYEFGGKDVLPNMTQILKDGMVPVVSYWKTDDLLWLDGSDVNGETPCPADRPGDCPLVGPRVLNFQVSDFTGFIHESTMNIKPTQPPVYGAGVLPGVAQQSANGAGAYGAGAYGTAANGASAAVGTVAYGAGPAAGAAYGAGVAAGGAYGAGAAAGAATYGAGASASAAASGAGVAAGEPGYGAGAAAGAGGVPPALAAAGWTVMQSGTQVYYYNTQTAETAWALPA